MADTATTTASYHLPLMPASFFGITLGLFGLSNTWRGASSVWQLSAIWGEGIGWLAFVAWVTVTSLYILKWFLASEAALAEAEHPVQCCFIGLGGVSAMLAAIFLHRYSDLAAWVLFAVGSLSTLVFALWRTGWLWKGGRDLGTTTAVLYLPTVAGSFTAAIGASVLGHPDWGQLAFGAGFFSWLAIESVLLNRMLTAPEMAIPLRPTLGIQLAPPSVGCAAYLSVTDGSPDLLAHALFGYALLQAMLIFRLFQWVAKQPFGASYWSITFGVTALATSALRMIESGDFGAVSQLAVPLFIGANVVIGGIALRTLYLLVCGKLIPAVSPR